MTKFSNADALQIVKNVEDGQHVWKICAALHEICKSLTPEQAWRKLSPLDSRWWVSMGHGSYFQPGVIRKLLSNGWEIQTSALLAEDLPPSLVFTWYWPQALAFVIGIKNNEDKEKIAASMFDAVHSTRFMEASPDIQDGMINVVEMLLIVVNEFKFDHPK